MDIDLSKKMYDGEGEGAMPMENTPTATTDATIEKTENNNNEEAFVISAIEPESGAENTVAEKKENARSKIAFMYVSSFLGIIGVVFAYSVISSLQINDVKDLLVTVSGILSGPLGFIIGYYFKVEEES